MASFEPRVSNPCCQNVVLKINFNKKLPKVFHDLQNHNRSSGKLFSRTKSGHSSSYLMKNIQVKLGRKHPVVVRIETCDGLNTGTINDDD